MDDDQKKLIPQLAIDTKFFLPAFANPCTMWNQRRSWSGVPLTVQLVIRCLIANYCTRWRRNFKGLSHDGGRSDFISKNLRASLFYDDLWTEPTFGLIYLAGQYL
jgi:hypothetical protein